MAVVTESPPDGDALAGPDHRGSEPGLPEYQRRGEAHHASGWTPPAAPARPRRCLASLREMASSLKCASRRGLAERFDSTIGAGSVLMPFGGKTQRTPAQAMAALLPVLPGQETEHGSVMAWGFDPARMSADPFQGAYESVITSVAKLIAAGCDYHLAYLTFQEYFEKLREEPSRWGKPFSALLGALSAQLDLRIAAIGGKDSMSGSFLDLDVPPTLISFAIAPAKAGDVLSPEFKSAGDPVYLFAGRRNRRRPPEGLGRLPRPCAGRQGQGGLGCGARMRRRS